MSSHPSSTNQLRRLGRITRGVRLSIALLATAALAALLWLLFGLADALAAFEPSARVAITSLLVVLTAAAFLGAVFLALRIPRARIARIADDALGDPREPATLALSLGGYDAGSPLGNMLSARALGEAAQAISQLRWQKLVTWGWLRLGMIALAVPCLIAGGLRVSSPDAFDVVASRLLHPGADIPPFSPLKFVLDPAKPSTVYGGDLLLSAEITGGKLEFPVVCLVRQPRTGRVVELSAFRESSTRYARTLDALTEEVEVAFSCGKARSIWTPVEILLEPEILSGVVRVRPPAYTGLAPASFPLDTNEISAIEGSELTLELTSNRPLATGAMVFTPSALPGEESKEVSTVGSLVSPHVMAYQWVATRSGQLRVSIRDVRGTPAPRPLEITMRCVPDQPPSVMLQSPPVMMLATPDSRIPVVGRAEDDFALSKVHIVRTLSGFRDRSHVVAPALRDATFDFQDQLDLSELGLTAGQTVEILLDAADHNPSLLGHGSSEICRIQIITNDQYAAYIRNRTTLREFGNRFRAAADAMNQARDSLDKLLEAVEGGNEEEIQKAAEAAREAHGKAADLMEKIAEDFPAFEMEDRLKELAREQVEDLRGNLKPLGEFDPKAPKEKQKDEVERMKERLNRNQQQAEQLQEDMKFHQQAAALLEMAAKFREIYENQASLSKRFGTIVEELRRGNDANRRQLPLLGETQEKNRKALDEFKTELEKRLKAVEGVEELEFFAEGAAEFLDLLKQAAPETLMDAATRHGQAGEAMDAFLNAERARALLEGLLNEEDNAFAAAARGEMQDFDAAPDVNGNLRQMLEGLLGRAKGKGEGGGQGQGMGMQGMAGEGDSGFSMNLPIAGPDRLRFGEQPNGGGRSRGSEQGADAPLLPETAERSRIDANETRGGQSTTADPESIPEPYRDAVKRFLSE